MKSGSIVLRRNKQTAAAIKVIECGEGDFEDSGDGHEQGVYL
jgi:hypothetical protein